MRRWFCFLLGLMLAAGCAGKKAASAQPKTAAAKANSKGKSSIKLVQTKGKAPAESTRKPAASLSVTNKNNQVITLTDLWSGKVASVNEPSRFVVLDYSLSVLPPIGQRLSIYRQGNKVGEVRVTGPAQGGIIAGDLMAGEAREGDEARRD